jgi:hypothetical protein
MPLPVLSRPHYGNIKMFSDENILMCLTSSHRAENLVRKNKAHYIDDSKASIKLNYTPKGLGKHSAKITEAGQNFFFQERQNICVCCGSEESLTKHHVVPNCFLKFFPLEYKNHVEHDIFLLCVNCHDKYELIATKLKNNFRKQYIPDPVRTCRSDTAHAYVAAVTLVNHAHKLPEQRIQELKHRIFKMYGDTSAEDVIANHKPESKWSLKAADWEYVVQGMGNPYQISRFWRQHFLDTMKPRFLPPMWSVEGPYLNQSCVQNKECNHESISIN